DERIGLTARAPVQCVEHQRCVLPAGEQIVPPIGTSETVRQQSRHFRGTAEVVNDHEPMEKRCERSVTGALGYTPCGWSRNGLTKRFVAASAQGRHPKWILDRPAQ